MKTRTKVLLVTAAVALPAFALGAGSPPGEAMWRAVWPWDTPAMHEPSAAQVPFFMLLGVFEAVALGLAVALLAFGRQAFADRFGRNGAAAQACTAWLLGNWWVHDSLHIVNGEHYGGLLVIEYAFHVTLIAAAAYLALLVARATGSVSRRPAPQPRPADA
ncbi:MAG TPA: hypothetical protein VFH47_08125 [Candidatus Thermoplasmatota archaeon]|nr:hypothetical protein [Candidatus Thermoplasmatota archaeon]